MKTTSQPSAYSVAFLCALRVKFRKAQHRGHKVSQRITEKSKFLFPAFDFSSQILDQGLWNSLAAGLGPCCLCGIARLSEDARPHGLELFSQAERVHSRGGTYRHKILVVVKQEFFRNPAGAQGAVHPFFKSLCNDGPPEPLLGGSMIPVLINGALKHGSPLDCFVFPDFAYICRQRTTYSMRTLKSKEIHITNQNKIRIVSSKRLGAGPRHAFLVTNVFFAPTASSLKSLKLRY